MNEDYSQTTAIFEGPPFGSMLLWGAQHPWLLLFLLVAANRNGRTDTHRLHVDKQPRGVHPIISRRIPTARFRSKEQGSSKQFAGREK